MSESLIIHELLELCRVHARTGPIVLISKSSRAHFTTRVILTVPLEVRAKTLILVFPESNLSCHVFLGINGSLDVVDILSHLRTMILDQIILREVLEG